MACEVADGLRQKGCIWRYNAHHEVSMACEVADGLRHADPDDMVSWGPGFNGL